MADLVVPGGLADITPEWMTAVLRGRGLDVEVATVTPARGSEGSGVNGVTERLFIDYARGGEGAPGSLVVKLPSTSDTIKGVAIRQRFYHNEIYFYEDFADKATVKIPQYYYGGIDDERQNFALLMQDMTPARGGGRHRELHQGRGHTGRAGRSPSCTRHGGRTRRWTPSSGCPWASRTWQ